MTTNTAVPANTAGDWTWLRRTLLAAGVIASALYITADIVCGLRYPGYSFSDQVISELSAIGAPTTALWGRLLSVFAVLFTAFAAEVTFDSPRHSAQRRTGWLLVAFVLMSPLWSAAPMHRRGDVFTWTDIGHITLGAVSVLLVTAVIVTGSGTFGRRFRTFSRGLTVVALLTGVLTFAYVPRMIAQQPTPGVGIVERVHLYVFWIWIAAFAIGLLRRPRAPAVALT